KPCRRFIHQEKGCAVSDSSKNFQLRLHSRGELFDIFILWQFKFSTESQKSAFLKRRIHSRQNGDDILYLKIAAESGLCQGSPDLLLFLFCELGRSFPHQRDPTSVA